MKKWIGLVACLFSTVLLAETQSPVGSWRTIDDATGKPKAIVDVSINKNNELEGRIKEVLYEPGKEKQTLCQACSGSKKNQPLVGLVFMEKLIQSSKNPERWEKGFILDPKTGKVYRCHLTLDKTNRRMEVRGYIGISLLGRTQHWERISN